MFEAGRFLRSLLFLGAAYCIYPLLHRITKKKTVSAYLSFAATFLGVAVLMAYCNSTDFPNYYAFLGISRDTVSVSAIRQAYRSASLQYHPDKSGTDSMMSFQYAKQAYDVLLDDVMRDRYNRFGPAYIASDPRADEVHLVCSIGMHYILWGIVVFCITASKSSAAARPWLYFTLMLCSVVEVMLSLSDISLPTAIPLVEFEAIRYMHTCIPAVLVLGCIVAQLYYVNVDKALSTVLQHINQYFETDCKLMTDLQEILNKDGASGDKVRKELLEFQTRSKLICGDVKAAGHMLKLSTERSNTNYFWIIIVGIYLIVSALQ